MSSKSKNDTLVQKNSPEYYRIKPLEELTKNLDWELPCSKSHFIRWLLLAAQSDKKSIFKTPSAIGNDIFSCVRVLEKLGIKIEKFNDYWVVEGRNLKNLKKSSLVLDCGNSATTLRFIAMLIARNGIEAEIRGDESLSQRNFSELIEILDDGGVSVKRESSINSLPFRLKGTFNSEKIKVSTKKTSQLISALLVTMPSSIGKTEFILSNNIVSKPYFELTMRLCEKTGANINFKNNKILVSSWKPKILDEIIIPGEASLVVFPLLFSKLHDCTILIKNWPKLEASLGFEKLFTSLKFFGLNYREDDEGILIFNIGGGSELSLNISDNIDLITPLSILMGISNGGIITGINNAINKESNRINSTFELCSAFGIKLKTEEKLKIFKSKLQSPSNVISAKRDHRVQMSAFILLSYTGGKAASNYWYQTSDPLFLLRLKGFGVSIN